MVLRPSVLSFAIIAFGLAPASVSSSSDQRIRQYKTKSATLSTPSTVFNPTNITSIANTWTTVSRSTASQSSTASATVTTTNYIKRLEPTISSTLLGDLIDEVKAQPPKMYSFPLGSRPNDTVICAILNGSSFPQFNADPLLSPCTILRPFA